MCCTSTTNPMIMSETVILILSEHDLHNKITCQYCNKNQLKKSLYVGISWISCVILVRDSFRKFKTCELKIDSVLVLNILSTYR